MLISCDVARQHSETAGTSLRAKRNIACFRQRPTPCLWPPSHLNFDCFWHAFLTSACSQRLLHALLPPLPSRSSKNPKAARPWFNPCQTGVSSIPHISSLYRGLKYPKTRKPSRAHGNPMKMFTMKLLFAHDHCKPTRSSCRRGGRANCPRYRLILSNCKPKPLVADLARVCIGLYRA